MSNIRTANEAMRGRYATKRMKDKIVPNQVVDKIIESIHLSPSSLGLQPYKIFVITNQEIKHSKK